MERFFIAFVLATAATAFPVRAAWRHAIVRSAIMGVAMFSAFLVSSTIQFALDESVYRGSLPYYEDGKFMELVVFPIGLLLFYGPLFAGVGAVVGALVAALTTLFQRHSTLR